MGILSNIIRSLVSGPPSEQRQKRSYHPPKNLTHEEYVVFEQEQSGERWHGVPLSELSKLAQTVYHGKYVEVDQYQFLVFYFTSSSNKTRFSVQCSLDENGQLRRLTHNYYPGQWADSADDFVLKANQLFSFR